MKQIPLELAHLSKYKTNVVYGYDKASHPTVYDDVYNAKGNTTKRQQSNLKNPDVPDITCQTKPVHRFHTTKDESYPRKAFEWRREFLDAQPHLYKQFRVNTGVTSMNFGPRDINRYTNVARLSFETTVGQDYVPTVFNKKFKKWLNPNVIPVAIPAGLGVRKNREVEIDVLDKRVTEHNSRFTWPRSDYRNNFNYYRPVESTSRRIAWRK